MSILSNIKQFGSNVVSSFGNMFLPPTTTPSQNMRSPSLTTNITSGLGNIVNSVFSQLANRINPPPKTTSAPITPRVITFLSGSSDTPKGINTILGMNTMGIVIIGGLIGFLVFMRKRR